MPKFSQSQVRSSVAAALFAVVMSTVTITSAIGPARAATPSPATAIIA